MIEILALIAFPLLGWVAYELGIERGRNPPLRECKWSMGPLDECWRSGCGLEFELTHDTPAESLFNFCPHCGNLIKAGNP